MKQPESETLIAQTFADTGIRLGADDPVLAVLLAQKRLLEQFENERQQQMQRYTDAFQAAFADKLTQFHAAAEPVIGAAVQLQKQREQLMVEILGYTEKELSKAKANVQNEMENMEGKLFGAVSLRIHSENEALIRSLKKLFLTGMAIALTGQSVVTLLMIMLLR